MSEIVTVKQVVEVFEQMSPKHLAYDWDKVGLQIGTMNQPVSNVMVTLDVLENVVDEAVERQIDLIISHHPVIFKPLGQINPDTPKGRVIQKLIKHDIAVYAAHTNLDIAEGGVNDALAEALKVTQTIPLLETGKDKLVKVIVFVPEDHADGVRRAMHEAGAGHVGDYSNCSFSMPGKGRFMPTDAADPYIGKSGELEIVEEQRVEFLLPQSNLKGVLKAMEDAHPYEEVAHDVYTLENEGESFGIGRIGVLKEKMTLSKFAEHVKESLNVPGLRVIGNMQDKVEKVAILGGSGEKYIYDAKRQGADVYVTGDMTFHPAQEAADIGLNVIDPGHHVEKVMKTAVKNYLDEKFSQSKGELTVYVSEANTEPFQFM
ncbi:Nif3-like dinuclear metal center hexameric protein [Thalassobacillus sp. B23F22_16]|uniref:Nif3-like dinuclear metal center hexameric protein n=1 Tax=Thalassobacillus sp. B23F22_16 TaxID=3459513 RepID=UPI00373EC249